MGNLSRRIGVRDNVARVFVGGVVAALLVTASGCGASSGSTSPGTTVAETSLPSLPSNVSEWLTKYNETSAVGRGESAEWVLTTRAEASRAMSGAIIPERSQVYVFDVHGDFAWEHSCPPGAPASACRSVGTHQVFTLDADRLEILGFGITSAPADLASLGAVGRVTL